MQEAQTMMPLPEASAAVMSKQQEIMQELELRRRMKTVVVPTNDGEVRRLLRELGEPITLFGEREMERSDRLRKIYALNDYAAPSGLTLEPAAQLVSQKEIFYTEGSDQLKSARLQIAQESLKRAARRLHSERQRMEANGHGDQEELPLRHLINQVSEIGDDRPIVGCVFSPDGSQLLTGSWSGAVKIWDSASCRVVTSIKAHTDRVTGVAWNPNVAGTSTEGVAFVSGATDGTACLWSKEGRCQATLSGHTDRLGRVAFHPFGRHVGTASFDTTWRFWDIATSTCLQEQEGHSRAVYAIAFQGDGALVATGGMDATGRLWDLRTGRNIMKLEGHVKSILAADFSPNGYHVATGSEDNTAHVFDLRKKGTLTILPGHTSLISTVRFEPITGSYLLTCGYDKVSKLWAGRTLRLAKTLAGHDGKVMAGDISPDGACLIATAGYDRTLKLYSPDALALSI
ncbi:PRP4 [Auxenochlorella protothecoides x Auxenochlorella symbiontica]